MQALSRALQAALQKVFMHCPSHELVCSPSQNGNGLNNLSMLCVTMQRTAALVPAAQDCAAESSQEWTPTCVLFEGGTQCQDGGEGGGEMSSPCQQQSSRCLCQKVRALPGTWACRVEG